MERLADLYLIASTYERDEIGQEIPVETESGPYTARISGITRAEWNAAGQQGLQPVCVCKLADSVVYSGQKTVRLSGCPDISDGRYSIYRTYPTNDGGIELYIREDAGS